MARSRTLVIAIIILVLAAAALGWLEFDRLGRAFYTQGAEAEAQALRDRFALFLKPPLATLALAAEWLAHAEPDQSSAKSLFSLLLPILNEQASVAAIALADKDGLVGLLMRMQDNYLGILRQAGPASPRLMHWQILDRDLDVVGSLPDDPTLLQSLAMALSQAQGPSAGGAPVWTEPHRLPLAEGAAISAMAPLDSTKRLGLCFSFSLVDLRAALTPGSTNVTGKILIFTPDGRALDFLTARGAIEQGRAPEPTLTPQNQIKDRTVARAMAAWQLRGRPSLEAFRFEVDVAKDEGKGRLWWAALAPVLGGRNVIFAGLALPQAQLANAFFSGKTAPLLLMAGGIGLALALLALLLARLRRGKALSHAYATAPDILALIAQGESERLEFKSTLRQNLAVGKAGKEIELATLKTLAAFMNTDGGVLLIGVNDAGKVTGLGPDGFENDDHALLHFTALMQQHLGIECAAYLEFSIRQVSDRKLLLVRCAPSPEPVFLRNGKDENFYVRVGPSSRKLSLSQFHKRLAQKRTVAAIADDID